MTQRDRVLAALRRAGGRGITQLDFDLPDVVDGGPPIKRVAARIDELRTAGHWIASQRTRQRMARYVLVDADTLTAATDVEPPPAPVPAPSASAYDPFSEWA
jgi:Helix-turn-helix domain